MAIVVTTLAASLSVGDLREKRGHTPGFKVRELEMARSNPPDPAASERVVCHFCDKRGAAPRADLLVLGWRETEIPEGPRRVWSCPACVQTEPAISKRLREARGSRGPKAR